MKIISSKAFKHTLRDIHKNADNRRFCFIIGAGASRKSGIPTGGELAAAWFSEIKERMDGSEFERWSTYQKIDLNDLAASYGSIYRKRYENDKTSGYEFLIQAMKNAKPSFGHIVLGQILSRTFGHCVITTNFDSLIESSIYQFTNKTPLICGHESLSGYARPSKTHPLIIKIHRDLLLSPKSDPDEINKLDEGWREPLDHIFSTHIPVIIGYGGNDGSLMNYFDAMKKPSNFFWCGIDPGHISQKIQLLIEKQEGCFVTIEGFDELMHELLWVFDEIKPINDELTDITGERIKIAAKQLEEIISIKVNTASSDFSVTLEHKDLSALEYSNLAMNEPDIIKRKDIYLEALNKYPETGWLWWRFIHFLQYVKNEYTDLDEYYNRAMELNKDKIGFIDNYGYYLAYIKKDYIKAEEFYAKSLAIEPENETAISNYANFIWRVKKDYKQAKEHYFKAFVLAPKDANINANYAQVLLANGEHTEAEKHIQIAFLHNVPVRMDLIIELWIYRFSHFSQYYEEADSKIEKLLSQGVKSIGWDFSTDIDAAQKANHPKLEKLKEFVRRAST